MKRKRKKRERERERKETNPMPDYSEDFRSSFLAKSNRSPKGKEGEQREDERTGGGR